jgi:hypothetical protein
MPDEMFKTEDVMYHLIEEASELVCWFIINTEIMSCSSPKMV